MKKIFLILTVVFLCAMPVSAQENIYNDKVTDFISEYNIDFEGIKEYPFKTLWGTVKETVKNGINKPSKVFYKIVAVLLITSLIGFFATDNTKQIINIVNIVSVLVLFVNITDYYLLVIEQINNGLFQIKSFMSAFIPIFAGVAFASGEMITSTVYTGFFMLCVVTVANFCISYIVPSVNLFLALGITSSISNVVKLKPICEFYSKAVKIAMTAAVSLLCFVLTLQTTITQGQDSLAVKTGKFIVSGAVPVIGSALQSAVGSIYASMGVLKGFFGIAGIVVIVNIFLPAIINLVVNWVGYYLVAVLGEMLENETAADLLYCFKDVTEILLSMCVLFMVLLVFSLTIMIKISGGI